MNQKCAEMTAECLAALAHPARVGIVMALAKQSCTVTDLAAALDLSQCNVSQHLAVLRRAGMVFCEREGQRVPYSLSSAKVVDLVDLAQETVEERLNHELSALIA